MTLRYVYGQDRNVARFVAQLIPHVDPRGFPADATAIGITDANNEPLAGIVYYHWNQRAGHGRDRDRGQARPPAAGFHVKQSSGSTTTPSARTVPDGENAGARR